VSLVGNGEIVGGLEVEAELDDLEIPVEGRPEELVECGCGFVEAVVASEALAARRDGEAGKNPAGFERVGGGRVVGDSSTSQKRDVGHPTSVS